MAYNPNIPQPPDIKAISQPQMLNNFIAINNLIAVNHQTFGELNEGKHKFLQMPEQNMAPTTAVNEAGLYAAVGASSGQAELVFKRETPAVNPLLPQTVAFTECSVGNNNALPGWTRLPSGLLMQWGGSVRIANPANPTSVTFGKEFSSFCYSVQLTLVNPGSGNIQNFVNLLSFNKTGFVAQAFTKSGGIPSDAYVYYLAIGI